MNLHQTELDKLTKAYGTYAAREAQDWWNKLGRDIQMSVPENGQATYCVANESLWLKYCINDSHAAIKADGRVFELETFGRLSINLDDAVWLYCREAHSWGREWVADVLAGLKVGEHFRFEFDAGGMNGAYKVTRVK